MTVRGADHRDVTADAVESGAPVGDESLTLRPALRLPTEFREERDGGIHVPSTTMPTYASAESPCRFLLLPQAAGGGR
ncbi:hypothetical protein GCM10010289_58220 [Streptomyces violascens]|nr:hypothetical protein GCM10010289_58220 [Streptomyces violascens]